MMISHNPCHNYVYKFLAGDMDIWWGGYAFSPNQVYIVFKSTNQGQQIPGQILEYKFLVGHLTISGSSILLTKFLLCSSQRTKIMASLTFNNIEVLDDPKRKTWALIPMDVHFYLQILIYSNIPG